jgi:plasmid rolling circle replication initiator protein Rep
VENERPVQHNLERERATWAEKKSHAGVMAQRLFAIGKTARCFRMKDCADTIISDFCERCEARFIVHTKFCRDRLCPVCSWRRSQQLIKHIGEIIAANEKEKHSRYIFLTLTVRNVPWDELAEQVRAIIAGWRRMDKRIRRAGSITGWFRTFEVTRSHENGESDAHPHFHVLMQAPPEYFGADKADKNSGLHYHKKDELIEQWRDCLREKYSPSISINAIKDTEHDIGHAVAEAAKYIAKDFLLADMEGFTDADFKYYVEAIHGVRAWATGGRMRISDDDIEESLHGPGPEVSQSDEQPQAGGVCRHCGGKLIEMREVWSDAGKAYTVKDKTGYNVDKSQKTQAHGETPDSGLPHGDCVVNLNINQSGGGNIYVGDIGFAENVENARKCES